MANASIDRFSGELEYPPVSMFCGYCGGAIHCGERYFAHGEERICTYCVKCYAYSVFIEQARVETAGEEEAHDRY